MLHEWANSVFFFFILWFRNILQMYNYVLYRKLEKFCSYQNLTISPVSIRMVCWKKVFYVYQRLNNCISRSKLKIGPWKINKILWDDRGESLNEQLSSNWAERTCFISWYLELRFYLGQNWRSFISRWLTLEAYHRGMEFRERIQNSLFVERANEHMTKSLHINLIAYYPMCKDFQKAMVAFYQQILAARLPQKNYPASGSTPLNLKPSFQAEQLVFIQIFDSRSPLCKYPFKTLKENKLLLKIKTIQCICF